MSSEKAQVSGTQLALAQLCLRSHLRPIKSPLFTLEAQLSSIQFLCFCLSFDYLSFRCNRSLVGRPFIFNSLARFIFLIITSILCSNPG